MGTLLKLSSFRIANGTSSLDKSLIDQGLRALRSCSGSHIVQSYSEARRAGVIPAEHALSGQRAPGFGHNRPHIREDGNSKPAAPCVPAHPNSQLCNQPFLEWVTFHLFGGSQWRWHLKNLESVFLGFDKSYHLLLWHWNEQSVTCIRKNTECFTSAVFGCATQRPKNPVSASALLTGNFLRVWYKMAHFCFNTVRTVLILSGRFQYCLKF